MPRLLIPAVVLFAAPALAATSIYYSVGTRSTALFSGDGQAVDGALTLVTPPPEVIGVGDEVRVGASRYYIIQRLSGGNEYLIQDSAANGGTPGSNVINFSSQPLTIHRAFNSLADAIDLTARVSHAGDANHMGTTNLAAADFQLNIACYADGDDPDLMDISADDWSSDATRYVRIFTPTTLDEVSSSQRHDGTVDGGGYTMRSTDSTPLAYNIRAFSHYMVIDGIKIVRTDDNSEFGTAIGGSDNIDFNVGRFVEVKNCLLVQESGGDSGELIGWRSSATDRYGAYIHDNILVGISATLEYGIVVDADYADAGRQSRVVNNTAYGSFTAGAFLIQGESTQNASFKTLVLNNYGANAIGPVFIVSQDYSNADPTFDYNAADDTSAGTNRNNQQVTVADAGFVDTTLATADLHVGLTSNLRGLGVGPDVTNDVSLHDIDGDLRDGPFATLGADEITCAVDDRTCDDFDDDCDGGRDEDYDADTNCYLPGECAPNSIASSCVAGVETPCQAGAPTGLDNDCNGLDEDCSGAADDNYIADTSCFLPGVCAAGNLASACFSGTETRCATGVPLSMTDTTCDDSDDDCDGLVDEDYAADTSCFLPGACASGNVGSSCAPGGTESACATGAPLSADDATCDTVDDDCDGLVSEDALLGSACGATGPCEIAVCNPTAGECQTSRRTGCCETPADCTTPARCITGTCDLAQQSCVYERPSGCCATDSDCNDGNSCTQDLCDQESGTCVVLDNPVCCQTDADCDDLNLCTVDECVTVNRCLYRPMACGGTTVCGNDTSCVFGNLHVRGGSIGESTVRVRRGREHAVMRLSLETEAIAGTLTELTVELEGLASATGRHVARIAIHADVDGDGVIEAGSRPLATTETRTTGRFEGLAVPLPSAHETHFLLTVETRAQTEVLGGAGAVAILLFLSLLLARGRLTLRLSACCVALIVSSMAGCSRSTLIATVPVRMVLTNVGVDTADGERLAVQSAPVASSFALDL